MGLNIKASKSNIIVIDDDEDLCSLICDFLSDEHQVRGFSSAEDALKDLNLLRSSDLILSDLQLPQMDGTSFIEYLNKENIDIPVILITAHASKESAYKAIQLGAYDYITKPLDFNELKIILNRALVYSKLYKENKILNQQLLQQNSYGNIIGKSNAMLKLYKMIQKAAKTNSNILIKGESGSGKELVARNLHLSSSRKNGAFIALNCSAIPSELLESELFGHKKGSFTGANEDRIGLFQEANGGSLFLDEIGDMPLELQAKLLRAIQEKKIKPVGSNKEIDIDVRIIAATHQDLVEQINEKEFREDLYYRLCVIPIQIPPLRDRKEDIPLLVQKFIEKYSKTNPDIQGIESAALQKLLSLKWNGNVRELENTIERAIALSEGPNISIEDITTDLTSESDEFVTSMFTSLPSLKQLERDYIQYVLEHHKGKKEDASKTLGINRKTLYRKEKEYQLD